MLVGNLFGDGEAFALAAWPLLLLLGLMASAMFVATALAGRGAALPALLLSLFFLDRCSPFLPNDIDHHNAQLALARGDARARCGCAAQPLLGLAAGILRRADAGDRPRDAALTWPCSAP